MFRDDETAAVAVLSRSVARRLFGDEAAAIGATLSFPGDPAGARFTVIGLVADRGYPTLPGARPPHVYVPLRYGNPKSLQFVVRPLTGDPFMFAPAVVSRARTLDSDAIVAEPRTMLAVEREQVNDLGWFITVFGGFGLAAILLAALGIYGVVTYAITRRTRELGVRIALGASRWRVIGHVAHLILPAAAVGLAAGVALSAGMGVLLHSAIFGVAIVDGMTLAAVSALFVIVAAGASGWPAWRASSLDPLAALRAE
jgi:ABC-type antimicrobial peptide transport system permease subunit